MTVTFVPFYIVCGCVKYIASVFSEELSINKTQKLRRGLLFTRTLMAFLLLFCAMIYCMHHGGKKGLVSFTVFGCFSKNCYKHCKESSSNTGFIKYTTLRNCIFYVLVSVCVCMSLCHTLFLYSFSVLYPAVVLLLRILHNITFLPFFIII